MVFTSYPRLDAGALILGTSLASYLVCKRYEPQRVLCHFSLFVCVPLTLWRCVLAQNLATCTLSLVSYNALILLFTLVYRLSPIHPLAEYPGPSLARISKLRSSYVCAQGKQHLYFQRLHEKYGDFVRTGPNELSVCDASAIPVVLGAKGLQKGPWWSNRPHGPVLVGLRDASEHARRREGWNRAFTSAAVKGYEDHVVKRCRQLVERFEGLVRQQEGDKIARGALLDFGGWITYFSTDLMGDMAFGGGFELVREGKDIEGIWDILESGLRETAVASHIPWIFSYIKLIPSLQQGVDRVQKFSEINVAKRMEMGAKRRDLFYHLNDEQKDDHKRLTFEELAADGILAIIAGSDTASMVVTSLFWYLLQYPAAYQKLKEEVDREFPSGEEPVDAVKLSHMTWLNGCINEASRLLPPVPGGAQRCVPRGAGPKVIGKHVVPDGSQVIIHTYSVHRDPRNFTAPNSFLPERWLSPPPAEIETHNAAAFFPYSYGPANCAGKNLAVLEMRVVICWLVQRFDMQRADGEKAALFEEWENSLQDFYVMSKGALWLRMVRR
ncbi:high nitrogen upregulated cytochrome P450 monooxygenase 2 [Artomyces pyxidatus]|uniref:High nitrogen upregulated cytochrome P450 monooxygenase 2 n=1 Tax=Artomyces pyxidatus TaxID=48021 RepID=A0ACB8TH24_9AGAM|nr:high nitrogen upregulated cytochrome P450 monooxygenase 2 [Artomyces pyxidatus]